MVEEWKDIEEYKGLYQVSNYGRVKSLDRWVDNKGNSKRPIKGKILKPVEHNGYQHVLLFKNGNYKKYFVHRMVAMAFIPNPDNLPIINHKDEKPSNNRVDNLEWCDCKYNINYGTGNQRRAEKQINGLQSKTVYQYSLDGELIIEYPSTAEVQRQTGYSQGNISQCCNGQRKTAYGYIWSYNKEPQSN